MMHAETLVMRDEDGTRRFERLVLPHLDAAYNLARWLLKNDHDAQDAVQDAMLRALRYIWNCREDGSKAWLLQIVRNCCFTWLKENRPAERLLPVGEEEPWDEISGPAADEPEAVVARNATRVNVNDAIATLPAAFRDVLILREFEDFSYAEIAKITGTPIGTVMSRLARARGLLREALALE